MQVSQGAPELSLSHLIFDFLHLWQAMLDLIGGRIPLEGLLPLGAPVNRGLGSSSSGATEEWLDLDPVKGCRSGGSPTAGGTADPSDGGNVSWNLLFGVVWVEETVRASSAFSGERIDSMR